MFYYTEQLEKKRRAEFIKKWLFIIGFYTLLIFTGLSNINLN